MTCILNWFKRILNVWFVLRWPCAVDGTLKLILAVYHCLRAYVLFRTQVKRIQNETLYRQYAVRKSDMQKQNAGIENEKTLWHGTSAEATEKINYYGFNRSYCGKNGMMLTFNRDFRASKVSSADKRQRNLLFSFFPSFFLFFLFYFYFL